MISSTLKQETINSPTTIKLFLVTGLPDGLRTAEISNWSGLAIAAPRADLKALRSRPELARPGVYFLIGSDDESDSVSIYVGEAENISKRLGGQDHANKDFWVSAICFVSKDNNLTKGHVKYLEGSLLDEAGNLGVRTTNGKLSGSLLPESDIADMEVFLGKIYQLLPVLGLTIFEAPQKLAPDSDQWLHSTIKGLQAKGRRTSNGFIVSAGSEAVLSSRPSATWAKRKRELLIEKGILVLSGDCLTFDRDFEFTSPTAAGATICGGATNGLLFWKDKTGLTLKELDSEQ